MQVKNSLFFIILFVLILPQSKLIEANECYPLSVTKLSEKPNYSRTSDKLDSIQLVDGKHIKHPMWLNRNATGWHNKTPVVIFMKQSEDRSHVTLKINTASRKRAGVYIPVRYDVYHENSITNDWEHIGFKQLDTQSIHPDSPYTIEIHLKKIFKSFALVIHSARTSIFIDEIELCKNKKIPYAVDDNHDFSPAKIKHENIKIDSINRLKTYYLNKSQLKYKYKRESDNPLIIEQRNCYVSSYSDQLATKHPVKHDNFACLQVISSKQDDLIINKEDFNGAYVSSIHNIHPILAADGEIYLDHITEGTASLSLELVPNVPSTILVQFNKPNNYSKDINVHLKTEDISHTLQISSTPRYRSREFYSSMWPYSDHHVFKSDIPAIKYWMSKSGDAIAFIPPHHMPSLTDKSWDTKRLTKLREELNLYKGNKLIAMLLSTYPPHRNGWHHLQEHKKLSTYEKDSIEAYIKNLIKTTEAYDLERKKWMLYIMDEINIDMYPYFLELTKHIKSIDNEIQIYANPVYANTKTIKLEQLKALSEYVDFWQYDLRLAKQIGGKKLKSISAKYTIYSVPPYITKAADPFEHYYLIPVYAWALGANGAGFWSLTHTSQSEALDDFDSNEADWAALYNTPNGIHMSTRYFAYLNGIQDYYLLKNIDERDSKTPSNCTQELKELKDFILNSKSIKQKVYSHLLENVKSTCLN